ncbi:MAG: hypothetical protein KBT36_11950 [Kurthia sp.]|nr:hypothetical protein [Candidatus Kurthia equi]
MTSHSLYLSDFFPRAGLKANRVKLVRYSLSGPGAATAAGLNQLFEYTQLQKPKFFVNIDYVLLFVTAKGNTAKFIGCYSTTGLELPVKTSLFPKSFPQELLRNPNNVFHPLEKTEIFSDLENRLFIDWGTSEDVWYQTGQIDKGILYIQNTGKYVYQGSQSVVLTYNELQEILEDPSLYSTWHTALNTMNAIYLITDLQDGVHFIGSSYTPNSLLSTWTNFIDTKDGGFDIVKTHLLKEPHNYKYFQFSILQVLPPLIDTQDIKEIKDLYRRKLGKNSCVID